MNTSILHSTKVSLGLDATCTHFDPDIIMHINTALFSLNQLGVGPENGFVVTDVTQTWGQFIGERKDLEAAKTYVTMSVKLGFDPPQSSFVITSMKEIMQEMAWRITLNTSKEV